MGLPHLEHAQFSVLAHSFASSRTTSVVFAISGAGTPIGAAFGMIIGGVLTELGAYVTFFMRWTHPT